MPQKDNSKRSTSKTRKVTRGRKPRPKVICKPGGQGKAISAVIADSIHSLKLKPKSGTYVFCNQSNRPVDVNLVSEMCEEIWAIYVNMMAKIRNEKLTLNPTAEGLLPSTVLTMALRGLRSLIPRDFDFNIEHTNGVFYIIAYKVCNWPRMWHCLEVGPALLKLAKKNKPLHDLYLSFLRTFSEKAGVGLWDFGELGYAAESLDDWLAEDDEAGKAEAIACLKEYRMGYIHQYLKRIRRSKVMKPEDLSRRARRFKAGNPIANLIYQGAEILKGGYSIHQFIYSHEGDSEDLFLELDLQLNIAWDLNDSITGHCETLLDSMAQEGVQEPVAALNIYSDTQLFDFDGLRKKSEWPDDLSNFFTRAWELTESFKK